MNPTLIVILGPTAVGKTSCAIQIAQQLDAEIFSADSRQFYKGIATGTAQPSTEELNVIKHHFVSFLDLKESYSVGQFEKEAIDQLETYFKLNKIAVLVGGSGLYIDAICNGLDNFPDVPENVKLAVEENYKLKGLSYLQKQLKNLDPLYYREVDLRNPQRLMRALGVCLAANKPYSSFRKVKNVKRNFRIIKIGLNLDRKILYDRINTRVDQMMEHGLLKEAQSVISFRNNNALNTVGYKELFEYFDGKTSLEEAIELIKRNTRRFAKRQMTWFNRHKDITWFQPQKETKILSFIMEQIAQEWQQ